MADAMYRRVIAVSISASRTSESECSLDFKPPTHIMWTHARLISTARDLTDTIPSLKWKAMYTYT